MGGEIQCPWISFTSSTELKRSSPLGILFNWNCLWNIFWTSGMYWCYFPHLSKDSVSPVCGIFIYNFKCNTLYFEPETLLFKKAIAVLLLKCCFIRLLVRFSVIQTALSTLAFLEFLTQYYNPAIIWPFSTTIFSFWPYGQKKRVVDNHLGCAERKRWKLNHLLQKSSQAR